MESEEGFRNGSALIEERNKKIAKASGQRVRTFVADEWTLEYDLALGPKDPNGGFSGGLAEDVFVAACLAEKDDEINDQKTTTSKVEEIAVEEFSALQSQAKGAKNYDAKEVLASHVYAKFAKNSGVSKAIAAQYLAERLLDKHKEKKLTSDQLRASLPKYLVEAIDYVTGNSEQEIRASEKATANE